MGKRVIALILTVIMIVSSVPLIYAFADGISSASVTVQTNKTNAHPGDEVEFSVVLQQTGKQNTFEATLDIPNGLTYVTGSLSVVDKAQLGWDDFGMNEEYLLFSGYGSSSFTSTDNITVATFKCTIDADAVGEYSVGLLDVVADDASYNTKNPIVTAAKITVTIPVIGISLDKTTTTVKTGNIVTLTPIFSPDTATNKNVAWTSSNEDVATVENGVVSGIKKGTAVITVKTEDGNHEDSCTVTVECSHTNTTVHPAEISTCLNQGHAEYYTCDACGAVTSGSNELLPLGDHTGGTATCKDKAICDVCHQPYGDYDAHGEIGIRDTKGATCCEDGYTGDAYCKDCNTQILSGSVIPATGNHVDADGKWDANGTQHWHTCYYGTQFDIATHTGGTATCTERAKCSVCGTEYGDYAAHQLTHHDRVEPDYENDGNIEYWACDECGRYFSDSEGHSEISADDVIIAKLTITEYQFLDGEVIIEAPDGAIPEGSLFDVQKIVPPPAEVVEKVKDQMGSSSEVLAYYEIRLSDTDGELIIHLDGEITIKIQMPERYIGSKCVRILQKDETGKLITMTSWWEGEYLCYKTDWLEIYN